MMQPLRAKAEAQLEAITPSQSSRVYSTLAHSFKGTQRKADAERHYFQDSYLQASIYLAAIHYSYSENTD